MQPYSEPRDDDEARTARKKQWLEDQQITKQLARSVARQIISESEIPPADLTGMLDGFDADYVDVVDME